jgi:UPF0042 nucleotide-binding protein
VRSGRRIALVVDLDQTETERLPPHRTCDDPRLGITRPLLHKSMSPHFPPPYSCNISGGTAASGSMTARTPRSRARAVVLVTGPSGAGRSTAINVLEDLGFEAIDNLPLVLLPRLRRTAAGRPLALGIDVRNRDFSVDGLLGLIDRSRRARRIEGLRCSTSIAAPRCCAPLFRNPPPPPAGPGRAAPIGASSARSDLLGPIRNRADMLIDTSDLSRCTSCGPRSTAGSRAEGRGWRCRCIRFSYKRGLPRGLDMVFDCRFLRNPHWEADLRPLTGATRASPPSCGGPALRRRSSTGFWTDLTAFLLPAYRGGGQGASRHRLRLHRRAAPLVAVAESFRRRLQRRVGGCL